MSDKLTFLKHSITSAHGKNPIKLELIVSVVLKSYGGHVESTSVLSIMDEFWKGFNEVMKVFIPHVTAYGVGQCAAVLFIALLMAVIIILCAVGLAKLTEIK